MTIVRIAEPEPKDETRKKIKVPKWDPGSFSDQQIKEAVAKAEALPGSLANANIVPVVFPVLPRPLAVADLDFGNVTTTTVKVSDIIASQTWVIRDRLIWHIKHPGKRKDNGSPFVSLPITAEGTIIVDGHHALSAMFLLGVESVDAWVIPISLATGHPR